MRTLIATVSLVLLAAPVSAADFAIGKVGAPAADGRIPVELVVLNSDAAEAAETAPDRVVAGEAVLLRAADQPAEIRIPAGGFARLRYFADRAPGLAEPRAAPQTAPVAVATAEVPAAEGRTNSFVGNVSAYEPVYAVYGPGTASDARLQISFKYQLFGTAGDLGPGAPAINGLHFAYTQRMFWDLGADSSPFRTVDYMPELLYLIAPRAIGGAAVGGQIGFRHESNGRSGADSRSLNTVYVQPTIGFDLGEDRLTLSPRLWMFVGRKSDNPDVARYRGNASLTATYDLGELRISATGRLNPDSGKGAIDGFVSYPLQELLGGGPRLYLVGQAFAGYGENLFDYRRSQTRLRIGLGIAR